MTEPKKIIVGISDLKLCRSPDILITYALGSCVGICLLDSFTGIAGLSHIMLPDSSQLPDDKNRMKFADTAIEDLFEAMIREGAFPANITAKIAGGASMFPNATGNIATIGKRNVAAVKKKLSELNIPIIAEDTGLDYGRTVHFNSQNGEVKIVSFVKGDKII